MSRVGLKVAAGEEAGGHDDSPVGGSAQALLFLPPYSPDFNPTENAFSKLKALLRKAAARTVDGLWKAVASAIDTFTPAECAKYFAAAGYDAW